MDGVGTEPKPSVSEPSQAPLVKSYTGVFYEVGKSGVERRWGSMMKFGVGDIDDLLDVGDADEVGLRDVQLLMGGLKISIHSQSHLPLVSLKKGFISGMHMMPEQLGVGPLVGVARAIKVEGSPGFKPGIQSHSHLPEVALKTPRCSEMQKVSEQRIGLT